MLEMDVVAVNLVADATIVAMLMQSEGPDVLTAS